VSFPIPGWQRARYADAPAAGGFLYGPEEETGMGKKIDIAALKPVLGTLYPPPFDEACRLRERTRLGDAAGLTQYGVNLMRLPPGAWSSQRHWHAKEDEFIYVLSGEVVLATDAGEELLRAGDCAGFKAGDPDGHCLQNRGTAAAMVLEIGSRIAGEYATYSDIDMKTEPGVGYVHKDGKPYPKTTRPGPG
jgi:uncharacterized cupin superfamily protein